MFKFSKHLLKNGIRLIIVPDKSKQVITTLVMFGVGSRYETNNEAGISHVLEHMYFKGTTKRPSALLVSEFIEEIGGEYNAFTSKEYTGYYVKAASKYLDNSLEFLSDILINSIFDSTELAKEKSVILQELDMYEDMPMEVVGNRFEEAVFNGNSLGRDIIGYKESIRNITSDHLFSYKSKFYSSNNCTIVVAGNPGNLSELEIVSRIEEKFTLSMGDIPEFVPVNHKLHSQYNITTKKTEQSHLVVGFPGVSYKSNDKFKLKMLSVILGGIASSRMFSEIRERRGLAYSVRSTVGNYLDTGSIETYAGVPHSEVLEVIEAMLCEYDKIKSDLTVAELNKAKGVLYGRILIGFDDTNELANHFALNETLGKSIMSPEELIKKYESISMDDLTDMANKYFDRKKVVLSFIGPSLETSKVEQLIKK